MIKRVLISLACLALVPVIGIGVLMAIRETPDGPRVEAAPGVVGVEAGGGYAWIVRTAAGAVLIDAGMDAGGTAILAELKAQSVRPDQVQAVLLTHGHPDHYAAAPLFPAATVFAGAADVPMMRGDTAHYPPFGRLVSTVVPLPQAPHAVKPVQGGEQLRFDEAVFTVIATPGHSPGSTMYLFRNILFSGDSLMRKGDGVATAPSFFSEDARANRASLQALESVTFETIADGHAGVTTHAKEKVLRLIRGE
jgi:glyoxylase-like metal-dependent hydrolase (beta-lactamase superfamily II)